MAAIWRADIYCDDCAARIVDSIVTFLWAGSKFNGGNGEFTPDGRVEIKDFATRADLVNYLDNMDDREYDSDDYPKWCSDYEESDCPQHCGSGPDCISAEELPDGSKVGYFFGNALTTDGEEYVKEAIRAGSDVARLIWAVEYDYLELESS